VGLIDRVAIDKRFLDPSLPLNERVDVLMKQMTAAEKVGQLMQLTAHLGDVFETIEDYLPGSLLHCQGATARKAIRHALENTRLGIPLLLADDAIHGHSFWPGATILPTQLAMACTWSRELLREGARLTAREMRATGLKWTFSPVLCLTRDLRWGRVNETFGEDPFLIGEFACAMIDGYQGNGIAEPDAVLATAKHFAGYSETQGGRDSSEADISRRKLRSYFLPPFEKAARHGCLAFMTGYQSMDGVPMTANRWLLQEVLKDEWGFEGILVTDWNNVGRMVTEQRISQDYVDAAVRAIRAGNDLMMQTPEFREGTLEALEKGDLRIEEIDTVCARILALKFRLGLFEDPGYPDEAAMSTVIACAEHREVNLQIARESLVLLRNNGCLPANLEALRKVTVIGPNADDDFAQLGEWSLGSGQMQGPNGETRHPRASITTVLDGIRQLAAGKCEVAYAKGCDILSKRTDGIAEAVSACAGADLVVLVIGDTVSLAGEEKSTATLELQGRQQELAEAVRATGKPVAVVLINSKPLVLPESVQAADAILEAFNPGMEGGRAIAETLFGLNDPCGRLTISFPYHVGQQPIFYSQVRGQHGNRYADLTQEPLYAFGEGLSYTTFEYGKARIQQPALQQGEELVAEVTLSNTGKRAGVEVVQAYLRDLVTSATWVDKALVAYERVKLAAGESRTVELRVPYERLSFVNADCRRVVEPGDFELCIGPSSRTQELQALPFVVADAAVANG
jgi:beta-glucosidase